MNSSLQVLFSLTDFVSRLTKVPGPLCERLAEAAGAVTTAAVAVGAASPRAVKERMDAITDKFIGFEQRDAHEFLSELVDKVHDEELEQDSGEDQANRKQPEGTPTELAKTDTEEVRAATDEYFRIAVRVCLVCDECGYKR